MLTDSHTHFLATFEKSDKNPTFLEQMKAMNFRFVMDIGTDPLDLKARKDAVLEANNGIIPDFMHFAVGIWPYGHCIEEPEKTMANLRTDLEAHLTTKPKYSGIGECGLDRFWNGQRALDEGRTGGTLDLDAEMFLFKEQIKLAKEHKMAVIIHTRDAFEDTLKCIDEVGHHRGIIHCYSYGIEEAKQFLERGWYISFPGNITFAKKQADKDRVAELIRSIPKDKILMETDAPYMAPVPCRGKINTPVFIEHTYRHAAEIMGISLEELANIVYENSCNVYRMD